MNLTKIVIAGCFVFGLSGVAAADQLRVDNDGDQNVVIRSDDMVHRDRHDVRVHEEHDRDWIRRHHHHDHDDAPHVDIDINR